MGWDIPSSVQLAVAPGEVMILLIDWINVPFTTLCDVPFRASGKFNSFSTGCSRAKVAPSLSSDLAHTFCV